MAVEMTWIVFGGDHVQQVLSIIALRVFAAGAMLP